MNDNGNGDNGNGNFRFLGLTKTQFLVVALVAMAIMFLVSVSLLGLSIRSNQQAIKRVNEQAEVIDQLTRESHAGLCAIKANAQVQVEQTADFLAQHPGAEPIPGISRESLIQSLDRQRAFRDALSVVDCR